MARAAGLGGGMGGFLAKPLILQTAELARRDIPISTNHTRTAEYLLALGVWPAIKVQLASHRLIFTPVHIFRNNYMSC